MIVRNLGVVNVISTDVLSFEAKLQLVARIADSSLFRKSPRLREFLLYTGDCTARNRLADVREQVIAEKVFQRSQYQDFQDSIVRAEARNLRKRLEKYFETEGLSESVVVTMPKGGYALAFEPRLSGWEPSSEVIPLAETAASLEIEEHKPSSLPIPVSGGAHRAQSSTYILKSVILLFGFLTVLFGALAIRWYPGATAGAKVPVTKMDALPFSALFDSQRETIIVTSDTAFLQISELEGRRLSLDDYLVRAYGNLANDYPPDLIQRLNRAQFTDGSEVTIAGLIMSRYASFLQRTFLRSGRQLTLSDFKDHNIVLLGSPISNPWVDLYSSQFNFQFDFDSKGGIKFRNRSPRAGEAPMYPSGQGDESNRTYAQVAFLPNPAADSGSVLLLAGTTAEATAAAGEFVLNEAQMAKTLKRIGLDPKGSPRYFELLLRATTFIGGDTHSEVIGYRLHPYSVP
jgi:hypothetical protein